MVYNKIGLSGEIVVVGLVWIFLSKGYCNFDVVLVVGVGAGVKGIKLDFDREILPVGRDVEGLECFGGEEDFFEEGFREGAQVEGGGEFFGGGFGGHQGLEVVVVAGRAG